MTRRLTGALSVLALVAALLPAQDPPPVGSATIEFNLPPGATATVDGSPVADRRATIPDLKPTEFRRVKVAVAFSDGATDERLVDLSAGLRVRMAVPQPGPEKVATVITQALVPVHSAAVSRDGRHIAVGMDDRTIVLWDTLAGRPVRTLAGHQKGVLTVAFSPDSKHLLSGSADATVVLWAVATGTKVRTYTGHTGPVVSAAFSPDGERFFTGSPDGTAILWDARTGERVHTLKSKGVQGVAYSPDGGTLGTASTDFTSTLWDARTGKSNVVLRGHREDVNCIAFSPDSRRVITGSSDDQSIIWDAATGKRITPTGRHTNNIHSVVFTPDGRRVISGEREELVMMWDAGNGAPVRQFVGHVAEIQSLVPTPDGRTLLTGSRDGTVRLWDLATGRELLALTTDGTRKTWAVVAPDGLFDGSESGRRVLGYRFRNTTAEIDQFFGEGYRPGLLAEVWRGERPFAAKPLGRTRPPLVRLVAPKDRTLATPSATLSADVTDQGGGVSGFVVENNGVRVTVPAKSQPSPDGKTVRFTFTVPLVPGANRIRARASGHDGVWESVSKDVELTHPRADGLRGRMYVVAVGTGDSTKDAKALAEHLRTRNGNLHDRVDVVPLLDRTATRALIEDTVKDVAELTRPQDALVVILCGRGALAADRLEFLSHDAQRVSVGDIAGAMGTAPALNRVLVVDAVGEPGKGDVGGALRGVVEGWGRAYGLHSVAALGATTPGRSGPSAVLHAVAESGALDVTDWVRSVAEHATLNHTSGARLVIEASTRPNGFPLFATGK